MRRPRPPRPLNLPPRGRREMEEEWGRNGPLQADVGTAQKGKSR